MITTEWAGRRCQQLGVAQFLDLAALAGRQHDGGDHERAGAGAPPGLVCAAHQVEAAPLQRALERVEAGGALHDGALRCEHQPTPDTTRNNWGRSGG
jgi:hypothetical protein